MLAPGVVGMVGRWGGQAALNRQNDRLQALYAMAQAMALAVLVRSLKKVGACVHALAGVTARLERLDPTPYTYTLSPKFCTLELQFPPKAGLQLATTPSPPTPTPEPAHPTPYTLTPNPYTITRTPYTLHPHPQPLHHNPRTSSLRAP